MDDHNRLKEIIEAIERIADLDFSKGVESNGTQSDLDMLAKAINEINDRNRQLATSEDADKQLLISERRFKQLFENATDSIFIIDTLTLQIVDLNNTAAEALGYNKSDLVGKQFDFIDHPDCATDLDRIGKKLRRKGHVVFEHIHKHQDGSAVPVEISANLVNYGGREVVQCFARNISARLEAQKIAQDSEQRWNSLTKNSKDIIAILDKDYKIIFQNRTPAALERIGRTVEDVLNVSLLELIRMEDHQVLSDAIEQAMDERSSVHCEIRGKMTGAYYDCTITSWLSGDKVEGVILQATDITDSRSAQMKLHAEQQQGLRYQSMLLSSQINPHFIFNSLNSVQFYIINKDVEPALNYISDFSVLMRSVLENSTQEFITIEDEISFLTMYLELEQKRFSDKFEYHFNLKGLDPDQYMIPPMLLQPYVENTVVHGLNNKDSKGDIWISFERTKKERIRCTIEDNGVGRDLAMKMKFLRTGSDHRSLGMSITRTRFDLLNSVSEDDYNIKVVDLEDKDGSALGTKILIDIPIVQE